VSAFSQKKEYSFRPVWKAGEKKTITISQHETEVKQGELVSDTTTYTQREVVVLKDNPDHYIVAVKFENIVMASVARFYERIGEDLPQYRNVELHYSVNKSSGKAELINHNEVKKYLDDNFKQVFKVIKKNNPDLEGIVKMVLNPVINVLKEKKNLESYFANEVDYLFSSFEKKYTKGDTITVTERCANPFNKSDSLNAVTTTCLSEINESAKIATINNVQVMDMTEFKKLLVEMMGKMAKSFGAEDSTVTRKSKELDDFQMEVTMNEVILLDYTTGWPVKVVRTGRVYADEPKKGKSEKIVIKEFIF
jgi:hypothetical protein